MTAAIYQAVPKLGSVLRASHALISQHSILIKPHILGTIIIIIPILQIKQIQRNVNQFV